MAHVEGKGQDYNYFYEYETTEAYVIVTYLLVMYTKENQTYLTKNYFYMPDGTKYNDASIGGNPIPSRLYWSGRAIAVPREDTKCVLRCYITREMETGAASPIEIEIPFTRPWKALRATISPNKLYVDGKTKLQISLSSAIPAGKSGYTYKVEAVGLTAKGAETYTFVQQNTSTVHETVPGLDVLAKNTTRLRIRAGLYWNGVKLDELQDFLDVEPAAGVADINVKLTVTPRINGGPALRYFVQSHSYAHAEVQASIAYGELTYAITQDMSIHGGGGSAKNSADFPVETKAGERSCAVVVTDTWGREAEQWVTYTVYEYTAPRIYHARAVRCDAQGNETESGTSCNVTLGTTYSECGGHNTARLTLQSKLSSESEYKQVWTYTVEGQSMEIGHIIQNGAPELERSYDVCCILTDDLMTVKYYTTVLTADFFMYFMRGGKGVAVGKAAELENTFDVGYDLRLRRDAEFDGEVRFNRPDGRTVTITEILEKLGL